MPKGLDLIGQKFGMLTVVEMGHSRSGRVWYCVCDCGKRKEKPVSGYELKAGIRTSCGCANRVGEGMRTHGQYNTKLYKVWCSMKRRCTKVSDPSYKNYGGRGITLCTEWFSFEPFYQWAMANGYREGLTIERIDNDGGYEPQNCMWIPKSKQSQNTRRCKNITYKGKTMNLKQWAKFLGMPYSLLQQRIRHGWDIDRAFSTPKIPPAFCHKKREARRMVRVA